MQDYDSKREMEEEITLPDDVMPNFDQMVQTQDAELDKTNQGGSKKQKV
jgi:hypothetical protein